MSYFLGILQFICIISIGFYEFKRKSPSVFLWATLCLMFGLMHFLTIFTGEQEFSYEVLDEASIFVILFCVLYAVTRTVFIRLFHITESPIASYDELSENIKGENLPLNFMFFVLLAVILIKLGLYINFSGGIANTSWGVGRDYSASLNYANRNQIFNLIIWPCSGLAVVFWLKGQKNYFLCTIATYLLLVLITRNRIEILPVLCAIITLILLKLNKISLKLILIAILSAVLVIYMVYGLWVFRHYGNIMAFIENFDFTEFIGKINSHLQNGEGELGLLRKMYFFIDNDNNFPNFEKMHTYLRMLLIYIPTKFSFGIKPPDFAISMGQAIGMAPGGSTHPTLFGDCYANAGMWGVFLGIFWALYVSMVDVTIKHRKTHTFKMLLYGVNASVFVIMGRGSVYNPFFFIAYGVPLLILTETLYMRFRIKKKERILIDPDELMDVDEQKQE